MKKVRSVRGGTRSSSSKGAGEVPIRLLLLQIRLPRGGPDDPIVACSTL